MLQLTPHGEEGRDELVRRYNRLVDTEKVTYAYEHKIVQPDGEIKVKKYYMTVKGVPRFISIDVIHWWLNHAKQSILVEKGAI